ncbi:hypothetical protein NMG60_11032730 [Bertholletia excelsa]
MASSSGSKGDGGPPRVLSRRATRLPTMVDVSADDNSLADSELVPSSLAPIATILRVANEIEPDNPRVAYLCRFHALERAHRMDPHSNGRGVRQFKTYLLRRVQKEEEETIRDATQSDPREIQKYYLQYYEKNIKDGQYTKTPEEMAKIYQIATVLYDVLRTIIPSGRVDRETEKCAKEVEERKQQYVHYNILPLYAIVGVKPAIMELPEIQAAIQALRNVGNLPMPTMPKEKDKSVIDILDWLSSIFGFQKGNVANQREHLILLLANIDARNKNIQNYVQLDSSTVRHLTKKIFKNYRSWCDYLHCQSNLEIPSGSDEHQIQLIYVGLYLLIWGEASNIRFMPECLCYIFHKVCFLLFLVKKKI